MNSAHLPSLVASIRPPPSILSIEDEIVYPWEIDITISLMTDVQERKLTTTKTTALLKTRPRLMIEGCSEGNSHSALDPGGPSVEICTTCISTPERGCEEC